MRLTPKEVKSLVESVVVFLGANSGALFLFGSRTNDEAKGGDIDLLLILPNDHLKAAMVSKKHLILADMKARIGEQKIDLKIASKKEIEEDPFLKMIYPDAILLFSK